jgi:hypothetical protein
MSEAIQIVVCADEVNLFGNNINATKKSTAALRYSYYCYKEVLLEVNTRKTKGMSMGRQQSMR